MSEPVVRAASLAKRYGAFEAVKGIDFSIASGECFGFLGPNGAGKTSTMRMMQSVSLPTSGTLSVLGLDPRSDGKRIRARLGVCPQSDNLDPDLNVHENLRVYASFFGGDAAESAKRADTLLEFVALREKRERAIAELSGGMKRRLVIARALMNDPELLLLDEPTTGLDPQARHLIWQKLRELKSRGVSMVLTTHYMDEAERLCDRIVIMDQGKILAEGSPRELIERHVGVEVFEVRGDSGAEALLEGLPSEGVRHKQAGDVFAVFLDRRSHVGEELVSRARSRGDAYLLRNATLEDVFLELTGRELNE
jgi:lipooligosaccharide transport system ATP-binding protein